MSTYIIRSLEPILKKATTEFPSVVLTGPRQSGKTTILKHVFGKEYRYVSVEPPDIRIAAREDPRGFLALYQPPVIIDEIQHAPELLPYIKEVIDNNRDRSGQYILTGSQNLLLVEKITESLAGRTAMLRLLPLSWREIRGLPNKLLPWETKISVTSGTESTTRELWTSFLRGGYPELNANQNRDISLWQASYVQTYLERDIRGLRQIGDLTQFQSFLRALAARSAQLVNFSDIARDLGIALNTVKSWLSLLEATYQVIVLRPYHANIGKRLVKSPKVYFSDVGTLCYLTGLRDPDHAASGPMSGQILETAVLSEIVRTLTHRGIDPQIYFWRTSTGHEVDFIIESEGKLIPVEVKQTSTPRPAMATSIKTFMSDTGDLTNSGYVVHMGNMMLPLGLNVISLPFWDL
ncbi:MAG: ATP-binding protein [Candidatus Latescibacteria bacterium]|nr:ATP-binding protein [Candidatus Latescibacterota bacterium]